MYFTDFEFRITGALTKEFSRLNCRAGNSSQANKPLNDKNKANLLAASRNCLTILVQASFRICHSLSWCRVEVREPSLHCSIATVSGTSLNGRAWMRITIGGMGSVGGVGRVGSGASMGSVGR